MPVASAEALEQYFAHLRAKGEKLIDGPLFWGFTFNSLPAASLGLFRSEVQAAGFDLELRPDAEGSYIGEATHFGQHTAGSLAKRWEVFEGIVRRYPPCALGGLTFQASQTGAL